MTNGNMKRALKLARDIKNMIHGLSDEYELADAIDAMTIVQASLLTGFRKGMKQSAVCDTLKTIQALVK